MTEQTTSEKQSRLGKQPVVLPSGVEATIQGQRVSIKGPKGEATRTLSDYVHVEQIDRELYVKPDPGAGQKGRQFQGLSRSLLLSMAEGVSKGYERSLDFYGVGYRAEVKGSQLVMALGLSHSVTVELPSSVKCKIETVDEAGQKRPRVHLSSWDKEALGQLAAHLRSLRPPEPYKGKGVRYTGERVREKAGKTAAKGKG
ncbi:MAG: 50S ribosomal protein L6 [Myxococcales bacterium]|nr:50S ribosomal protein L6 [Myxococcales bacterium]